MLIFLNYAEAMKRLFLLWLVLGCAYMTHAQTITILDKQSKKPLEGVFLISKTPQASTTTNAEGHANISSFKDSEEIIVHNFGYETSTVSYTQLKDAGFELGLHQLAMNIDQMVISATKWHQSSDNVPYKITTISPEEIALQNPQTAADMLGISGKVFIQKSQQGGGSPMIRGFATNRLVYSIDGIRMNTAIFRGGNLQNVINLDPFAIENTEVFFGPGSVIYGSDAIGGVMSFQTLKPQFSYTDTPLVTGKAVTRHSSANNEKTGHADINVGWKKWAMVTSFSFWDFDHLRQGSHGPDEYIKDYYVERQDSNDVLITQEDPLLQIPSAYAQTNLMQKIRFKPNEAWDYEYGFHYSETSSYGRYDRHNRVRNGTARYAEWNYGPQKWMMNNFSVHHQASSPFYDQMTLRMAYQTFEESRISRDLNSDTREKRIEKINAYSINLDLSKNTGKKNTLYYGVEYVKDDISSTGTDEYIPNNPSETTVIEDGPDRYPQSEWKSIAAYLNDEFKLSDKITLQAGLRYNQFHLKADFSRNMAYYPFPFTSAEINSRALTGSLGGVFRPTKKWIIKVSFGTAFRAPNVDDIGKVFDSEPGAVVVPNPSLEAEYAYNFDLGLTRMIGEVVKIDLTGYYTILQNALVRRDYQLNGQDSIMYDGTMSKVQAIQNAAVAYVYGIQAGIEIKLPFGFTLLSDLNYQAGEEELDDGSTSPSRHAAPLFGISRLRYHYKKLTLELNTSYQAERTHDKLAVSEQGKDEIYAHDAEGNTYSPAWYTLNVKVLYELSKVLSLSGGVENLTDQRYRPYSSGISGAGRNFLLSLRADF